MLEHFYECHWHLRHMPPGPLLEHINGLAAPKCNAPEMEPTSYWPTDKILALLETL
jgi:hypothetical protein